MKNIVSPIPKRTKIVATLGPSSDSRESLMRMIAAGLDVARLNFSHGKANDHIERAKKIRACAKEAGREIAIMADLQGPKIRIGRFKKTTVFLKEGDKFILDAALGIDEGTEEIVGIVYKTLPKDVKAGNVLLLDDGRIVLLVKSTDGEKIICEVQVGGELSNNKGINLQGGGLSAPALTEKDKEDLKTAVSLGADYIAISFPRTAEDMLEARKLVEAAGGHCGLIAKIERADAIPHLDEIIRVSEGVMVARGDLGVEIGEAELPAVQKLMIGRARALDKLVITATQMMESMIHNAIPTRAEVFDVANAVLDGTDAVMLSAETATGDHPDKVISAMARICLAAEKQPKARISGHRMECHFERPDEAIAMAAMYMANHLNVKTIIALTESGATPLWMSRIRSGIPIYALTPHINTERKMALFRGVYPIAVHFDQHDKNWVATVPLNLIKDKGIVQKGDWVLLTYGDFLGKAGSTNTLKVVEVT